MFFFFHLAVQWPKLGYHLRACPRYADRDSYCITSCSQTFSPLFFAVAPNFHFYCPPTFNSHSNPTAYGGGRSNAQAQSASFSIGPGGITGSFSKAAAGSSADGGFGGSGATATAESASYGGGFGGFGGSGSSAQASANSFGGGGGGYP